MDHTLFHHGPPVWARRTVAQINVAAELGLVFRMTFWACAWAQPAIWQRS